MFSGRKTVAAAAVLAAAAGQALVGGQIAYAGIGCGNDVADDGINLQVSVQRAMFSCDIVNFGVRGGRVIGAGGARILAWGPDGIRATVTAQRGEYVNVWSGDKPPGRLWCGKLVNETGNLCVST